MLKYSLAIAFLMSVFAASDAAAQTSLSDLLGLVDDDDLVVLSEGGALDSVASGALDTSDDTIESIVTAAGPANTTCQPPTTSCGGCNVQYYPVYVPVFAGGCYPGCGGGFPVSGGGVSVFIVDIDINITINITIASANRVG